MVPEIPEEQVRFTLEAVAREVLAEGRVDGPPVDAVALAQELGVVVARDGGANVRARYVRLGGDGGGQGTILLADEPRAERRHWAVAHEIGECYAFRVFEDLGIDPAAAGPAARERAANLLAGCLLLPRDWLLADGAAVDWDLFQLKAKYATASHEMIARRMLEMPPPVIVTLYDHGRPAWRRSNRNFKPPQMTAPETSVWQAAHRRGVAASAEASDLPEGLDDVRAWPVHEPRWKREIVRTALLEMW